MVARKKISFKPQWNTDRKILQERTDWCCSVVNNGSKGINFKNVKFTLTTSIVVKDGVLLDYKNQNKLKRTSHYIWSAWKDMPRYTLEKMENSCSFPKDSARNYQHAARSDATSTLAQLDIFPAFKNRVLSLFSEIYCTYMCPSLRYSAPEFLHKSGLYGLVT